MLFNRELSFNGLFIKMFTQTSRFQNLIAEQYGLMKEVEAETGNDTMIPYH